MGPFEVGALGVLTGLVFVLGSLVVILVIVMAQIRNRRVRAEMLHQERMAALEKGLPVPVDFLETGKRRRPFVQGLVWAAVGAGFILWGVLGKEEDLNGIGMIPLLVGIALVIGDWITVRREKKPDSAPSSYPTAGASHQASDNPS
jgi:hypothetical protein